MSSVMVVRTRRVLAWLAVSGASWACTSTGEEARFVPGEVIVKFRAGTAGARAASEAAAAPSSAEAKLAPQTQGLCDAVGVPLRFRRVASGGDVLLAIDAERLQQKLLEAARGADRVGQAELVREAPGGRDPSRAVRVRFAPSSPEARELARAASGPTREGPLEPLEVTRRLQSRLGFPLTNRLGEPGELVVEPDLTALTREVVQRLSKRPDVEYAQLNHVVRTLRP